MTTLKALIYGDIGRQPLADLGGRSLGTLAAGLQQREDHEREIARELLAGLLYLERSIHLAVKRPDGGSDRLREKLFDIHVRTFSKLQI